jgi:hypothetical protein
MNHGHRRRRDTSKRHQNIFNKIIAENIPSLEKEMVIQVQKALKRLQTDKVRKESSYFIL